jgi:CheY-like chemotaxis protein
VVTAQDAAQALERLKNGERVDLVFSDVVMPGGMSGIELARAARAQRPDIRVLLTSGYVGDQPISKGEFPLIDKPYERAALAAKLRELLGRARARRMPRRRRAARELRAARAG